MATVREILRTKSDSTVWTIGPDESVFEALRRMAKHGVGALVVVERGHIVGIISEREYARKIILHDRSSKETSVSEIMRPNPIRVDLARSVDDCMALMTDKHIRHLPVVQFGKLIGIISIGDLVKAQSQDQEFMIEQLTRYVTDSFYLPK